MIPETEIIIRALVAGLLGSLVGYERERQNQPAGLRTHIILVVGAALAMALSINIPIQYRAVTLSGDPARLAAQVISGIGFLGAGAILRYGLNVKGLTTATSLWTMAIVGLAVGAGYYLSSILITLFLLIVLVVVNIIEQRFIVSYIDLSIALKADDRPGIVNDIKQSLSTKGKKVQSIKIKKNIEENKINVIIMINTSHHQDFEEIVNSISEISGVRSFEIS